MDATKLNSKGVGYNQAYMVDVGGQWSTDSKMYTSYPVPVISSVVAPRLDTAGGETVTITGLHFGPVHSNNLIVGTYVNPTLSDYAGSTFNASNCYVSVGHTEITCTSVEGVGYDQVWDVDVGNQLSADSSDTTSYHRPQVHSLEQLSGYSAVTELKTNGSDYIIVNGSYFGPANPSNGLTNVVGYYYNNTLLSHLAGKEYSGDCVVVSQTVMHCATSAGVGYDHEWRVVVGEQTGPSSTVTSSYHVPVIEGLYQYQSYNNLDELNTDGRDEILIKGMYFGPADGTYTGFTNDVNGYYNNSELSDLAGMLYSTNCTVLNDTFMECGVQTGVGHDHQWQIVVGEQPSEYSRDNTSYIIPSIKNITTSGHDITSLLTSGGESITLTGTNFGPVSPFNGELNPISAVYERFSSDLILGLAADQFQALSCSVIIAHIQITCTSAIGVGELHYWTVTVGDQSNMPTNDLVYTSYEPPEIVGFGFQNVLDLTLGSTESTTILIHGTNFGPVDSTNYVNASYSNSDLKGYAGRLYDALNCTVVTAYTTVNCTTSPGVGFNHSWEIEIGGQISNLSTALTSYPIPNISNIVYDLLDTEGNETVTLTGANFGPVEDINYVNASYVNPSLLGFAGTVFVAERCSVTEAHTTVVCYSAEGIGANQNWIVNIGEQDSETSLSTTSYLPPVISDFIAGTSNAVTNLQTDGSDPVFVSGDQFGPKNSFNLIYGLYNNSALDDLGGREYNVSCEALNHTVLRCDTAVGVGHDQKWRVIVGSQTSDESSGATSYETPAISAISMSTGATLSTSGSESVTLTGTNFGPLDNYYHLDNVVNATYQRLSSSDDLGLAGFQFNATGCYVSVAHTEVTCTSVPGVGQEQYWILTVGDQQNPASEYTSYTAPQITEVNGISTPGESSILRETYSYPYAINITGTNFGPVNSYNYVNVTFQNDELDGLAGTLFEGVDCVVSSADEEIHCSSPPGVGYDQAYMVDVGGQWSNSSEMYISYPIPVINNISPDIIDTSGGETIVLTGLYFGPAATNNLIISKYVNPDLSYYSGSTFNASNCYVSVGHTEITCTSVEGVGYDQVWYVDVGNQESNASIDTTSYFSPVILSLEQQTGYAAVDELHTDGSDFLLVNGSYFGPPSPSNGLTNYVEYYYNNSALSNLAGKVYSGICTVLSQTVMQCPTNPGVGHDQEWRVIVGEQTSSASTMTTSYHQPVIEQLKQYQSYNNLDELSTDGSDKILITGQYFGPADGTYAGFSNSVSASYNNSWLTDYAGKMYSASCTVLNHTSMYCQVQTGVGHDQQWQITVGEQNSAYSTDTTSYHIPSINMITTSAEDIWSLATGGGDTVTITGENFGPALPGSLNPVSAVYERLSSDVGLGLAGDQFTAASCTIVTSHTVTTCTSVVGVGKEHYWTLSVGNQSNVPSTNDNFTSYEAPQIDGFGPNSAASFTVESTFSRNVLVHGTNFGPVDSTNYVNASYSNDILEGYAGRLYHAINCTVVIDDVLMNCTTAPGVGFNHSWQVEVGKQTSNPSTALTSYPIPFISGITAELLDTKGHGAVTLSGENFGPVSNINFVNGSYQNPSLPGLAGKLFHDEGCSVTIAHTTVVC